MGKCFNHNDALDSTIISGNLKSYEDCVIRTVNGLGKFQEKSREKETDKEVRDPGVYVRQQIYL